MLLLGDGERDIDGDLSSLMTKQLGDLALLLLLVLFSVVAFAEAAQLGVVSITSTSPQLLLALLFALLACSSVLGGVSDSSRSFADALFATVVSFSSTILFYISLLPNR